MPDATGQELVNEKRLITYIHDIIRYVFSFPHNEHLTATPSI